MNLDKLCESYPELLHFLEEQHYSHHYIKSVEWEIKWICKKKAQFHWTSYVDICNDRIASGRKPESTDDRIYHIRSIISMLQRFEENGEYPNRRKQEKLIKWSSYYKLNPQFKEILDLYVKYAEKAGYQESTIRKRITKGACFLLHFQNLGYASLENITEQHVISYFTDKNGNLMLSSTYKREIASILNADLGDHSENAKRLLQFLPAIQNRRKNIKYLTSEESALIRRALSDTENELTYRERAVGTLLFFTGLRAGDVANLRLSEIDWMQEQITLTQRKTGYPIIIPLSACVGNALYDYIVNERPQTQDDHVFLWCLPPYNPIDSTSIWPLSAKVYKAAGVRQARGERRGSHLFRHHLATHLAQQGVAQPVISDMLGHEDPHSLDHYLSADITHLRQCALSIEEYPVSEEVFCI